MLGGLVAIRAARRRARIAEFGFVREKAHYAARRWMVGTGVLALLGLASVGLWAVAVYNPEILPTPVPTATSTLIPSPTPRPPTSTPTVTSTTTAAPTAIPIVTATAMPLDVDLPGLLHRPQPAGAVTPGPDALLVEVTLAAGEEGNKPVHPTTVFARGTKRVYAFMFFDGMSDRVPWTHVWYGEVDGQMREIWGETELWSYEYSRGQIWRYFDCSVGNYELRVYVGQHLQQKVPFVVQGG
jgi:hypothetical protein